MRRPASTVPAEVAAESLAEMIAPSRTALLVIDVQTDFAGPTGAMARAGASMAGVEPALERIERLVEAARRAAVLVVFARVLTRPDTDSAALKLLNARKGRTPDAIGLCREGEPGSAYHRVRPAAGDLEIEKRLHSAFHGTALEAELRRRGIDTLVLCGFSTHCCVDSTARDAFHRDFNVFVVADATDAYAPELQRATLAALGETCALVTGAAETADAWTAAPPA